MDSNTELLTFILENFGFKGIYVFAFAVAAFLIFFSVRAIKRKKITHAGGESTGKSAIVIGALFLITTIVILIALISSFL